ncbi:MAG: NAD-dependent epimerase/dehydratase family protein [Deltaproteobacteria bacterium]
MKIFLTGASGFVGSHVLDLLRAGGHEVSILLQRTSNTRFISRHVPEVKVHFGPLDDVSLLTKAVSGVEAVVHCAGRTKALQASEFYRVNQEGTRKMVMAANACKGSLRRFVYISSQAVSGPAGVNRPAEETGDPRPVSVYGRSKSLGEAEIRKHCRVPWIILRPAAVYGPRDTEFLPVFRKVKQRLIPLLSGTKRSLNMIYGPDVAVAVLQSLVCGRGAGETYHVAAEPPCTDEEFMEEIAAQLRVRPVCLRIPRSSLYLASVIQEILSRATGRPKMLSRQKLPELLAPGWVCSTSRIRRDMGFTAPTSLREGVKRTIEWYRREGWL